MQIQVTVPTDRAPEISELLPMGELKTINATVLSATLKDKKVALTANRGSKTFSGEYSLGQEQATLTEVAPKPIEKPVFFDGDDPIQWVAARCGI